MVTILLVDDEPGCRAATVLLLKHLGYEVETAAGGEEALGVFDPARHALVVTDNRMPGMSGAELVVELRRRAPTTPIVLFSGWPETALESVDAVIAKPASIDDFRCTLARLLPEGPPTLRSSPPGLRPGADAASGPERLRKEQFSHET